MARRDRLDAIIERFSRAMPGPDEAYDDMAWLIREVKSLRSYEQVDTYEALHGIQLQCNRCGMWIHHTSRLRHDAWHDSLTAQSSAKL